MEEMLEIELNQGILECKSPSCRPSQSEFDRAGSYLPTITNMLMRLQSRVAKSFQSLTPSSPR